MNENAEDLLEIIENALKDEDSDLKKSRHDLDEFYHSFNSHIPVKILKDDDAPVTSYWIVTPQSNPDKILLFFHGGEFNRGSTYGHENFCGKLAKYTGFTVFSIDYRLAPEHPFPAAVEDCLNSFLWLLEEGFNAQDIVITGISAGGTLALSTVLALKKKDLIPLGAVCMSPAVDLNFPVVPKHLKDVKDWINHEYLDKIRELYLQGHDARNPLASPIYGDLEGLPPILLQVGGRELLLCDMKRFHDLAVAKEVEIEFEVWQDMFHSFQIFSSKLPQADAALKSVGEFVRKLE